MVISHAISLSTALEVLERNGMRLEGPTSESGITLVGGSNLLTRVVGVAFATPRKLPKRVYVRVDNESRVTMTCESTLRWWAWLDPLSRRKYARVFDKIAGQIEATLVK